MSEVATPAPHTAPTALVLPAIRPGLQYADGPADLDGRASLQIVDPVRNAYFRAVYPASIAIRHWQGGDATRFGQHLTEATGLVLSRREIAEVADFLLKNELTVADRQDSWQGLADRQAATRHNLAVAVAHNYLFFRIPLLNPDRLLDRIAPRFAVLLTRGFAIAYAGLLAVAAFLILRQWDSFTASVAASISADRLPLYAVLLFALKCIHELGHAVMAKHHGCRVPTMGVALMLGAPVLYTDTTDIWRLNERGKRLSVVLAGVGAEMLVAGVALLAWSFLPDGAPRQMACALASMSLLTSLAINLNPCMRFDGYFALSDLMDVPNLQDRAFALTREHLRHVLLGLPRPPAPDLTARTARLLVVYGYATWLYRLVLYVGIAVLVYLMSFKLLGLALFAFEMAWFIARPLWAEARLWWAMRHDLARRRRARWSLALLAVVLVFAVLPVDRVVEAPAVRVAGNEAALHAATPARVVEILTRDGAEVRPGEVLARLEAPSLVALRQRVEAEIVALQTRLARTPAVASERESALVLASQLDSARERRAGLERLAADLEIRAPMAGIVVDLDPALRPGVWINQGQEIARIVAPDGISVRALVDEADIRRLNQGASAVFVPETGLGGRTTLRLVAIAEGTEHHVSEPVLADVNGGPIATSEQRDGLVPRASLFAVTLQGAAAAPLLLERGTVRIAASGESPAGRALRRAAQVLTRESGF
ncbi:MAG: HlyD family efflux transporter periplasmic adaptor subunit [Hyphomicrobiaceae bacterium]|nr:HlyD family efflux transporter periplasmic adaptor subunit [Hyphomicrobiaceae bacterium]